MGIPEDATWILNVGELIPRKNQETLVRAVARLDKVYLLIAGRGGLEEQLKMLANELNVSDRVKLLGFRTDISELCKASDIFAFSSIHEGLPVSVMEAMASGLPCVVSHIRGNVDLIAEGEGGFTCAPSDVDAFAKAISTLANDPELRRTMGEKNLERIKDFELSVVIKKMTEIYKSI